MAIHDNDAFRRLLASLSLEQPAGPDVGLASVLVGEATEASTPRHFSDPEILLWYRTEKSDDASLEALLKAMARELEAADHPTDREVMLMILALIAIGRRDSDSPDRALVRTNEVLTLISQASVSLFWILPAYAPAGQIQFGSFRIGELRHETLAYRCMKARCDYFALHGQRLKGRMAIEQDPRPIGVVPWHVAVTTVLGVRADPGTNAYRLVDLYFHRVASSAFRRFWRTFVEQQQPFVACGLPFTDDRIFREMQNSEAVAVFQKLDESGAGWVAPGELAGPVLSLDASFPTKLRQIRDDLAELGFGAGPPTPLAPVFDSFSRFVLRAKRHESEQRVEESYLHHVIALDLAFGEKTESARSVSERVAALLAGSDYGTFDECVKTTKRLYDLRSRYVHQGQRVNKEDLRVASNVTQTVAWTMLRSMREIARRTPRLTVSDWLAKIDYVAGCLKSGEAPSADSVSVIGVPRMSREHDG